MCVVNFHFNKKWKKSGDVRKPFFFKQKTSQLLQHNLLNHLSLLIWVLCPNSIRLLSLLLDSFVPLIASSGNGAILFQCIFIGLNIQADSLSLLFIFRIFIAIHIWLHFHVYSGVIRHFLEKLLAFWFGVPLH